MFSISIGIGFQIPACDNIDDINFTSWDKRQNSSNYPNGFSRALLNVQSRAWGNLPPFSIDLLLYLQGTLS
jgi:hypothetical protein